MGLPSLARHRRADGGFGQEPLYRAAVTVIRSIVLFVLAAIAEIGGCWLIWQSVREHRSWPYAAVGVLALGAYGFVASFQPDASFGEGGASFLFFAVVVLPDGYCDDDLCPF